jgi:hypothetical protein
MTVCLAMSPRSDSVHQDRVDQDELRQDRAHQDSVLQLMAGMIVDP